MVLHPNHIRAVRERSGVHARLCKGAASDGQRGGAEWYRLCGAVWGGPFPVLEQGAVDVGRVEEGGWGGCNGEGEALGFFVGHGILYRDNY